MLESIGLGVLTSALYDAIKKGKDLIKTGFWGFIVETKDEFSIENPGTDVVLEKFFFDEKIAKIVDSYRNKGTKIEFKELLKIFKKICKECKFKLEPEKTLRDFFDYIEEKISSNKEIYKKIILRYSQDTNRKSALILNNVLEMKEEFKEFKDEQKGREINLPSKPKYHQGSTKFFVGREKEIEDLTSLIKKENKILSIIGEGGLGKTSFAVRTIRANEKKFELVIPLYFEQLHTFDSFLSEFSARLNLNQSEFAKKTDQQKIEILINEIEKRKKVLIFADNYEAVLAKIQDSSPDEDKVKINNFLENIPENTIILLTSRLKHNLTNEEIFELSGLRIEDGISLFKTLTEKNLKGQDGEQISKKIKQLVERVGGHPLAIELLARTYSGKGEELDRMIENLGIKEINPKSSESRLRSLKACFDYSIKFLDEKLKELLFDLTIFKYPFPLKIATKFFDSAETDIEKLHYHSLLQRIEKDEFGDLEREYWLYDFHPVIKAYLESELKEKGFDLVSQYGKNLGIFYGKFLSEMRDAISSEKRGYLLRQFNIVAGTIPNDIDTFAELTENKNVKAQIFGLSALLSHHIGFFQNALTYYHKVLSIFPLSAFPKNLIPILGNFSNLLSSMGNIDEAIELQKEIAEIFEREGDKNQIGIAYDNIGLMYYRSGRSSEAKSYLEKAREILQKTNNKASLANTYLNLGNAVRELGDAGESLKLLEMAKNIFEQLTDPEKLSICYIDIATTYSSLKDDDKALEFLKKSAEIAEKQKDKRLIAKTDLNFGIIYTRKRDLTNAKKYLEKSLLVLEKFNDVVRLIDCNYRLGDVYFFDRDLKNAMKYHQAAFSLAKQIGNKNDISKLGVSIAAVFAAGGYFKESLECIKFVIPILKKRNYHDRLTSCKDILKIIIEAASKNDKTKSYSNEAKILLDHINE